jgi:hypothetical protein
VLKEGQGEYRGGLLPLRSERRAGEHGERRSPGRPGTVPSERESRPIGAILSWKDLARLAASCSVASLILEAQGQLDADARQRFMSPGNDEVIVRALGEVVRPQLDAGGEGGFEPL